ncbi:MAG: DNA repair protein RecN [Lachnospiraceae bacterium]|nr:DNA repair protein RecN [Lachnospiraceae bacterium]
MLESIRVKNLALIKESEIELKPGLNILTGETGAGKSVIMGSVRLALGERARADMIRNGEDHALIELTFHSDSPAIKAVMDEYDIPYEDDGVVIITRRIQEGRSTAKCNGEAVSARALKKIASGLINIHGQNDTQSLLDDSNYIDILDEYGGEPIDKLKEQMVPAYREYTSLKQTLEKEKNTSENKDRDLALAGFELEEIENAALVPGEDDRLEELYKSMVHARKIEEALSNAYSYIKGDHYASDSIDMAVSELNEAMKYKDSLQEVQELMIAAEDILNDCGKLLKQHIAECEYSEEEFNETESRLNEYNRLKSKYGRTVEEVLKYAETQRAYIDKMTDYEAYINRLTGEVQTAHEKAIAIAGELHNEREICAKKFEKSITTSLKELNFQNIDYKIDIKENVDELTENGMDAVDFLVSFNVGEPVRSLSRVASGGELSRFMLALKAVTADKDSVETLLFDEIDAGISGKTAWKVAEKMALLSKGRQVIAITHLPQIGAMADVHYMISKSSTDDSTVTDIERLSGEDSVRELARLISGGEVTETGIKGAGELIADARIYKAGI